MTVDGRDIQGWFIPAGDGRATARRRDPRRPAHALRLVAGLGVPGPRGGRDRRLLLQPARLRGLRRGVQRRATTATGDPGRCATSWPASTRSSPTASPTRTGSGVTGGSYGGYLTNWIVGHDQRFRAAMTCRSVNDMGVLFTTGDIAGGDWARLEFETTPWDDPAYFREISPITYADADPDAAADPALGARPAHDDRPGRGAVHGPALAAAGRSGCCACPRRPTS